jgi:hypothetical protein
MLYFNNIKDDHDLAINFADRVEYQNARLELIKAQLIIRVAEKYVIEL